MHLIRRAYWSGELVSSCQRDQRALAERQFDVFFGTENPGFANICVFRFDRCIADSLVHSPGPVRASDFADGFVPGVSSGENFSAVLWLTVRIHCEAS